MKEGTRRNIGVTLVALQLLAMTVVIVLSGNYFGKKLEKVIVSKIQSTVCK